MIADTYTPPPGYALDDINYIRNSVKATVDAQSGEVTLYAWDTEDPMLQTWDKIFPGTIKSADEMSDDLLAHVRYPADLFKVQRSILETYHVTDAGTFYSANDAWVTPDDPTQPAASAKAQPPYYLTMQVPGTDAPAFTLYSTYIPRTSSGDASQSVLTGYLAVNSDAGPDYGKLTLLTLPKDDTVPGPGQAQNQFKSDTVGGERAEHPGARRHAGDPRQPADPPGRRRSALRAAGLRAVHRRDQLPAAAQGAGRVRRQGGVRRHPGCGPRLAVRRRLRRGRRRRRRADARRRPIRRIRRRRPSRPARSTRRALEAALADYQEALADRTQAYADGDLVAAAQADERMQQAIEDAIAATGG